MAFPTHHIVRRLGTLLLLLAAVLSAGSALAVDSLDSGNAKYIAVKKIYDNIARAFGDGRTPPRLIVRPKESRGGMQIAYYYPGSEGEPGAGERLEESYIVIDEKIYDLLAPLGGDRDSGLAVLIAHEMTHYYRQHGWVGDFGNAFADTEMGKSMQKAAGYEEVIKLETEADYFGGFYGYLAGYNTLGLAPRVIDLVYREYKLPDKLSNYPSRAERKAIAERTEAGLRRMAVLFDAANRLLVLKRYPEAARLFDYISRSFPSREMLNNAGVARALEALQLFRAEEVPYAYPLEFDAQTRLRGKAVKTKGASDAEERRTALLRRAAENFEAAIRRDRGYATAQVNLAAVSDLLGDRDLAAHYAARAVELARQQGERATAAHALIVRGIVSAKKGQRDQAWADFAAARPAAPTLAELNAAVLQGSAGGAAQTRGKGREITAPAEETIGGLSVDSPKALEEAEASFSLKGTGPSEPLIKVLEKRQPGWDAVAIETGGKRTRLLSTTKLYRGESARGIKIGSRRAEVVAKYGEPARVLNARQGTWYVYELSEIVFTMAPDDTVSGWLIYGQEILK